MVLSRDVSPIFAKIIYMSVDIFWSYIVRGQLIKTHISNTLIAFLLGRSTLSNWQADSRSCHLQHLLFLKFVSFKNNQCAIPRALDYFVKSHYKLKYKAMCGSAYHASQLFEGRSRPNCRPSFRKGRGTQKNPCLKKETKHINKQSLLILLGVVVYNFNARRWEAEQASIC